TTADTVDANIGDGICADANGLCSLRAAVQETNALAGPDSIIVPAGIYLLTIAGAGEDAAATGDLDITDTLTINGAGPTATIIDSNFLDRVVHVLNSVATLNGIALLNGAGVAGGGIFINSSVVMVDNSTISNNSSSSGGGGIWQQGASSQLNITNSTISGNSSLASGANGIDGGGLAVEKGLVSISNSLFDSNISSADGGGIDIGWASGAVVSITDSTFSNNQAQGGSGGAIYDYGSSSLSVSGSSFVGNSASASAGALSIGANAVIVNSTISGNTAGSFGGGIFAEGSATPYPIIRNCTITGNTATNGGGVVNNNWQNGWIPNTHVTLENSIVANQLAGGDCWNDSGASFFVTNSIDTDGSCNAASTVNPLLGTLGNYGGPTQTIPLLAGSPAIDAAYSAVAPATDQRGVTRNGPPDIGAFEYWPGGIPGNNAPVISSPLDPYGFNV
ncbi:MAG: hypothetical protein D6800_01365, partial [Candidatus Zixiibacteriota bacterium]